VSERGKNIRNVFIVLGLAAIVWGVPGGDTASTTISNLLSILLFAGLLFFAYRLYMEHRTTLYDLPDNQRVILYGSAALTVITLVATSRMWNSGGAWVLLWFALLGIAAYGFAFVIRAWRTY
jgi:tellurite resistance protein TehA-like permease